MAYDEDLAARIREHLAATPDVGERAMFGGLAFLVSGHMAIAASREGGILVRVDPSTVSELLRRTKAVVAVMSGRPMTSWLRVAAADVRTSRQLARWIDLSVSYAATLPPRPAKASRRRAALD